MNRNEFEEAYLGKFDPPNSQALDLWCVRYSLLDTFEDTVCTATSKTGEPYPSNAEERSHIIRFKRNLDDAVRFIADDLEIPQEDRDEAQKEVRDHYSDEVILRRAATSAVLVHVINVLVRKHRESSSPTHHVV